jgi:hypothetical protein
MNCPVCNQRMDTLSDEVDIGVGTLTRLTGWECVKCDVQIGACAVCHAPSIGSHKPWCEEATRVCKEIESADLDEDLFK